MVDSRMEKDIGKEPALRNFPLRGYTKAERHQRSQMGSNTTEFSATVTGEAEEQPSPGC